MSYILREGSQEPIPFYLTRDDAPFDLRTATEVRLYRHCGSGLDDVLSTIADAGVFDVSDGQAGVVTVTPVPDRVNWWTGLGNWAEMRFEAFVGGVRYDFPSASHLRFKIVKRI